MASAGMLVCDALADECEFEEPVPVLLLVLYISKLNSLEGSIIDFSTFPC